MRRTMFKIIQIFLILPLVFLGCKGSGVNIKLRFDQIQGLKEGDPVIFEQNRIGEVTGLFYSADSYYMVDLAIKKDFANVATEYSKFFIIGDLQNREKKAIEIIQTRKGGTPLENGVTVEGSTRSSAALNRVGNEFEKGLDGLKEHFEHFFEYSKTVPESQEFKKLEKGLERLAEEMKRSVKSAREKIKNKLLPRLQQEIEKLREELKKFGREKELEPLETQMENIKKI